MEREIQQYQKIKVSREAYLEMKKIVKSKKYRGRGMVGLIDELVLGGFSTRGSGRIGRNSY